MHLNRYLNSMRCKHCKGKGCAKCNYTGGSVKFQKLLKQATSGLR